MVSDDTVAGKADVQLITRELLASVSVGNAGPVHVYGTGLQMMGFPLRLVSHQKTVWWHKVWS